MSKIELYDTTLRDGAQFEGISLSVEDKLAITRRLDQLGVHYVEGGWPGSNPKDADYFRRVGETELANAAIAAFGSTRYPVSPCRTTPTSGRCWSAAPASPPWWGKAGTCTLPGCWRRPWKRILR